MDLFEALKAAFPEDIITRVAKGVNGADVNQVVRKNGKAMGTIVYESKNVKSWNDDYIPKLLADKLAAKADHAVLSAYTLPPKCQQITIRQGVVICSPARVLVIAELLRGQVIQIASLKITGQEKDEKMVELYEYMTTGSFYQHFTAIDAANDKLVEVDETERKAHERTWEKRSQLIRRSQRALSNLLIDVERITGVANSEEVIEDAAE